MTVSIRLQGYALHRGVMTAVTLVRCDGPLAFEQDGRRARVSQLTVQRSDAGVTLSDGHGLEVDLVEHLLAALGGLGIRSGVTAIVEGAELPILDGGARTFADALVALELPARSPEPGDLIVSKPGRLSAGSSSYTFDVADDTALSIEAVFDHPAIGTERASWDGSSRTFLESIAPARTFGFRADGPDLWRRGRAELAVSAADSDAREAFSRAVIVFDATGPVAAAGQAPPSAGEIGRHKLLDLIGDFALHGGPPRGRVLASRPGHTASHRIIRQALALGILSRR
ncbi:MAG TPA: UDP-3-O-acyl-N-acetylglucosamine deacetylase [Polyangiaceae bacterium]|nr:UDP-3-O-acyl-N-acetylglucosamine deacetylase [Polyangiaceae bacterium]